MTGPDPTQQCQETPQKSMVSCRFVIFFCICTQQTHKHWVVSVRDWQSNKYECAARDAQCKANRSVRGNDEVFSHCCRLQRLRHRSAHGPRCLMVRVTMRWYRRLLVPPEPRWGPGKARYRRALLSIMADKVFRVSEGLLSNLQRYAREAGQHRLMPPLETRKACETTKKASKKQ